MAQTLYEGISPYNGGKILAALSLGSGNRKTGNLDTLWILPAETEPHKAVKAGEDSSVCGECPHRRDHGSLGDCYVLPFQAPLSVWRSAQKPHGKATPKRAAALRLGGYGDPAMLPETVVAELAAPYATVLGYTHQWRHGFAQWAKRYTMASADSLQDKAEANHNGWRTFRVTYADDLQPDEIWCPATTHGLTCQACGLCQGTRRKAKNIAIRAHGAKSKPLMEV